MSDPRPLLYRALDQAAVVVRGVTADQLALPTPCHEFDVTGLLIHIVGVGNRIASIGRGEPQVELAVPEGVSDDGWGDAFDETHDQALASWSDDEILGRKVELPFGTFDGATVAGIYTLELTTHSWDLARATAQLSRLDDELARVSLAIAERALPPEPRGGAVPFEPVVDVAPDASPYDQLAAFLGRQLG